MFYITITGFRHYFGRSIFDLGKCFILKKEPENDYDRYAIEVYSDGLGKCGYVADAHETVVCGTSSAKMLYGFIGETAEAEVRFIAGDYIIAEITAGIL